MKFRKILALVLALVAVNAVALASFDTAKEIAVVSREEGSGTRGAFVELTGVEAKDESGTKIDHTYVDAIIANNTATVLTTVAGNEYAIGYISLASLNDTVKALKVGGVEATTENILNKSYVIARPFNVVTSGEALNDVAADFLAFIMSEQGQEIVTAQKAVSVANAETVKYESKNLSGKITVGGSSSVSPLMEKMIEAYKALNPEVSIELQTTDSPSGVTGALNGTYQSGMASRELKASELEKGAKPTVIAMDGIAVIVNPANTVEDIELEQVRKVFIGEITTWADLGK